MRQAALSLIIPLIFSFSTAAQETPPSPRIIGYYPSYVFYGSQFFVTDIAADKLTHINYAFARVSDTGEIILGDEYADTQVIYPDGAAGNLEALARLKRQYPHLQTLIS